MPPPQPADAGDELADDRADHRQTRRDPQPGHDVRQRGRELQLDHPLPPRGVVQLEHRHQIVVRRGQPGRRVGDDREERDQERDHDHGRHPGPEPDHDQRRNGHDRDRLEQDGVREDAALEQLALRHQPARSSIPTTIAAPKPISAARNVEISAVGQALAVLRSRPRRRRRRGQQEARDVEDAADDLPGDDEDDEDQDRRASRSHPADEPRRLRARRGRGAVVRRCGGAPLDGGSQLSPPRSTRPRCPAASRPRGRSACTRDRSGSPGPAGAAAAPAPRR